jgi:hypothetical protein
MHRRSARAAPEGELNPRARVRRVRLRRRPDARGAPKAGGRWRVLVRVAAGWPGGSAADIVGSDAALDEAIGYLADQNQLDHAALQHGRQDRTHQVTARPFARR